MQTEKGYIYLPAILENSERVKDKTLKNFYPQLATEKAKFPFKLVFAGFGTNVIACFV